MEDFLIGVYKDVGQEPKIIRIEDSFWDTGETYHVKCANCNVETQTYFRKIDAIEAWNRRVDNDLALSNV